MGQKVLKVGRVILGEGEGCVPGVQDPRLGISGGLQGLPRAAGLWDELGDTKVPELPATVWGTTVAQPCPSSPSQKQAGVAQHHP